MTCSTSCGCCHGIWKPSWARDRILPGDTGRSWFFTSPGTFAIIRVVFSIVGFIFLIYSAITDKPPPQPTDPQPFAHGWFAYWKFYSNWTLALCAIYCTSAALFSYALWKHERTGPSPSHQSSSRPSSPRRFSWDQDQTADTHAHQDSHNSHHHHNGHDDEDHHTNDGLNGTVSSGSRSSTRFMRRSDGASMAFDSEGELEAPRMSREERTGSSSYRLRSQSQGPSARSGRDDDEEMEELQPLDHDEPLEFPASLQVHRPHRAGVEMVPASGNRHHGHRRKISPVELCLWLMYQTVWAAAIFCACTFWVFIGIGCLPRKGCTSVATNFWIAQVINVAFIAMELIFNKLPFVPFHSVLTLGYCVLWLVFSAILWSVTGNWIYPRSASHGQLYSAVTFWPGWIFLNVGAFFVGLGLEWALAHWIFPTKHSIKEVGHQTEVHTELDIETV